MFLEVAIEIFLRVARDYRFRLECICSSYLVLEDSIVSSRNGIQPCQNVPTTGDCAAYIGKFAAYFTLNSVRPFATARLSQKKCSEQPMKMTSFQQEMAMYNIF